MTDQSASSDELQTLEAVRAEIDRVDEAIVGLLAARGRLVGQAARFKRTAAEAAAPDRARAVLDRVRAMAVAQGADPDLVGDLYALMIQRFVSREIEDIRARGEFPD